MRKNLKLGWLLICFLVLSQVSLLTSCDSLQANNTSSKDGNLKITPGSESISPVQYIDLACDEALGHPVHVYFYAYNTNQLETGLWNGPDGENYYGKKLFDSNKSQNPPSDLKDDLGWIVSADDYLTKLARQGYGSWDGCYGNKSHERLLTFNIHYPDRCGWQGKSFAETIMMDKCLSPTAYTHEMIHAVVDRMLGIESSLELPQAESAALYESFSDIFALVISDPKDEYTVNLADDENNGKKNIARNLAITKNMGDYVTEKIDKINYPNSLIFSHAAYLLMHQSNVSLTESGDLTVKAIGKEKVGRIFFNALSPTFIRHRESSVDEKKHDYTFEEAALGIIDACQYLRNKNMGEITSDDCEQVKNAFLVVGILKTKKDSTTDISPVPEPSDSPVPEASDTPVPEHLTSNRLYYLAKTPNGGSAIMEAIPGENNPKVLFQIAEEIRSFKISANNQIVIETGSANNATLSLVESKDKSKVLFAKDVGYGGAYSFSPTGSYLTVHFAGEGGSPSTKTLIDLRNGATIQIGSTSRDVIWSPDESAIAFEMDFRQTQYEPGLYIASVEDSFVPYKLEITNDGRTGLPFDWSPDGQTIYFSLELYGNRSWVEMYSINKDGSNQKMIFERNVNEVPHGFSLSPDGRWIGFKMGDGKSDSLYVLRPEGGYRQKVFQANSYGNIWSPDSRYLAFYTRLPEDNAKSVIWIASPDGKVLKQITAGINNLGSELAWSPDSQFLAFLAQSTEGTGKPHLDVFVVDLNGADPVNISKSPDSAESNLSWWTESLMAP